MTRMAIAPVRPEATLSHPRMSTTFTGGHGGEAADDRAAAALERLANLRRLLTAVEGDTERDVPGRVRMAQEVGGQVMDHLNELKLPGWGATQAKQFREEINEPLQSAKPDQMNDSAKQQLLSLRPEVLRWEGVLD